MRRGGPGLGPGAWGEGWGFCSHNPLPAPPRLPLLCVMADGRLQHDQDHGQDHASPEPPALASPRPACIITSLPVIRAGKETPGRRGRLPAHPRKTAHAAVIIPILRRAWSHRAGLVIGQAARGSQAHTDSSPAPRHHRLHTTTVTNRQGARDGDANGGLDTECRQTCVGPDKHLTQDGRR